jgi:hypothetical protein
LYQLVSIAELNPKQLDIKVPWAISDMVVGMRDNKLSYFINELHQFAVDL